MLTRYEDVKRVCLDTGGMSSDRLRPFFATLPPPEAAQVAELMRYLTLWMVFRDPPEHTRLRRLAAKVFNVRSIHALAARASRRSRAGCSIRSASAASSTSSPISPGRCRRW